MLWTPEQDATLIELRANGLTSSQIGMMLGITRNAVIGRAHRLAVPKPPRPITQRVRPVRERKLGNKLTKMMFDDVRAEPLEVHAHNNPYAFKNVPFMLAGHAQCREVVGAGDDGLALFCGAEAEDSWCFYHASKNFTVAKLRCVPNHGSSACKTPTKSVLDSSAIAA